MIKTFIVEIRRFRIVEVRFIGAARRDLGLCVHLEYIHIFMRVIL